MSKDIDQKIIDLYQESGISFYEVIESLKRLLATAQKAKESVECAKK